MKTAARFNLKSLQLGLALCLIFLTVAGSGCEPMRKKFVRQKKKDVAKEEMTPILEPVDYKSAAVTSPQELYKVHYSLWQIWHNDLTTAISEGDSDKKKLYDLDQEVANLREMQSLLPENLQEKLRTIISRLTSFDAEFKKSMPASNASSLKLRMDAIAKDVRSNFKFSKVQDQLVAPMEEVSPE